MALIEKVKNLCELVREIPYKRIGGLNPQDMLEKGKGSCTPKHLFLASYLRKLNIPVKLLIIPFYYKNMSVKYPKEHIDVVEKMPISYHVALKAFINGEWRVIDVTWDSPLKKLGFVVNDQWDGNADMKLTVVPEDVIEVEAGPEEFEKKKLQEYTKKEKRARKEFYLLLDEMMETVRK